MTLKGQRELFTAITEDGSISLVSGEHGELYHNLVGAYTEALCNYSQVACTAWGIIHAGALPPQLNVLDACFGLGYNSFVLAQELPAQVSLNVTAIELDPGVLTFVPQVLAQSCFRGLSQRVGQAQLLELSQFKMTTIHRHDKNSSFSLNLVQSCLRAYLRSSKEDRHTDLDLVLHDPFSPKKMPELWTIDLFNAYKQRLKDGGMILTYSSAPAVRGALLDLGFYVYRTPSLGGKWGGTLAIVGDWLEGYLRDSRLEDQIMPLSPAELIRLAKSSRVPYRDPDLAGQRDSIVAVRQAEQKAFAGSAGEQ